MTDEHNPQPVGERAAVLASLKKRRDFQNHLVAYLADHRR
jgi:hypothetical protein